MRLFKQYEIDPDEQRQAIADWLSKKLNRPINPKNIGYLDGREMETFLHYKEIEKDPTS